MLALCSFSPWPSRASPMLDCVPLLSFLPEHPKPAGQHTKRVDVSCLLSDGFWWRNVEHGIKIISHDLHSICLLHPSSTLLHKHTSTMFLARWHLYTLLALNHAYKNPRDRKWTHHSCNVWILWVLNWYELVPFRVGSGWSSTISSPYIYIYIYIYIKYTWLALCKGLFTYMALKRGVNTGWEIFKNPRGPSPRKIVMIPSILCGLIICQPTMIYELYPHLSPYVGG